MLKFGECKMLHPLLNTCMANDQIFNKGTRYHTTQRVLGVW